MSYFVKTKSLALAGKGFVMKKLCVCLMTIFMLLSIGAFAESNINQDVKIYAKTGSDTVKASVFITKGTGIVGHFGIKYNTEKLELVRYDGTKIPDEFPEQDTDGSSYLGKIVKAASDNVIITPDSNKVAELVLREKGQILFGWYSAKNVIISPALGGGKIADVVFKLKDGKKAEDIVASDFSFITKTDCDGISGWGGGIITISSDEKAYYAQSDNQAEKLGLKIQLLMNEEMSETLEEELPAEDDKTQEAEQDEQETPEVLPDDAHLYTGTKVSVETIVFKGGVRLLIDDGLANINVPEYRVFITDNNGNTIRNINGIVGITRSLTIKDIAPDFDLNIEVCAYAKSGELLGSEKKAIKTASDSGAIAKTYTVKYDIGNGTSYGFSSEEVLFGGTVSKTPTIYAPEGYKFVGWSVDGENVVDIEKYNIYQDTVFISIYEKI